MPRPERAPRPPVASGRRMQGAALAFGLIFLLLLTIIGLAAVRASTQQARMAANFQSQTEAFQAAETAISGVMDEVRGVSAAPSGADEILTAAINAGEVANGEAAPSEAPTRDYEAGARAQSQAVVTYRGTSIAPGNSMGVGSPSIVSYRFRVDGTSSNANTQSQAEHWQGIQRVGPGS